MIGHVTKVEGFPVSYSIIKVDSNTYAQNKIFDRCDKSISTSGYPFPFVLIGCKDNNIIGYCGIKEIYDDMIKLINQNKFKDLEWKTFDII